MEDIGELIGKGFDIWKRNLNLCIPYVLNLFASILVFIAFLMAILIVALPLIGADSTSLQNIEDIGDAEAAEDLLAQMSANLGSLGWRALLPAVLLFLGMIALFMLVGSFFNAGAIGMARQAQELGSTDMDAMWSTGRKNFWNMFLLTLLIGLAGLVGFIFLVPGIVQMGGSLPELADSPEGLGLLIAGAGIFILYALIISVILSPAPYALVLEGLGPLAALKAGIDFFRYNKFDVMILWLVAAALSLTLQMIGSSFSMGEEITYQPLSAITGLVSLLVLAPLTNLWWTRLYMVRKGMLKEDEVKDSW